MRYARARQWRQQRHQINNDIELLQLHLYWEHPHLQSQHINALESRR